MKKFILLALMIILLLTLCGCNDSTDNPFATKVTNTKAYIKINEKTIVVDVKEYVFGSNGTITIYETNGKKYKTHAINVVLVKDADRR